MREEVGRVEMRNLQAIFGQEARQSLEVGPCRDQQVVVLRRADRGVVKPDHVDIESGVRIGLRHLAAFPEVRVIGRNVGLWFFDIVVYIRNQDSAASFARRRQLRSRQRLSLSHRRAAQLLPREPEDSINETRHVALLYFLASIYRRVDAGDVARILVAASCGRGQRVRE